MVTPVVRHVIVSIALAAVILPWGPLRSTQADATRSPSFILSGAPAQCRGQNGRRPVAVVDTVSVGLSVRHGNGPAHQASGKMPIYSGDLLSTNGKEHARVTLCDGSAVYIDHSSQVSVPSVHETVAKRGQVAEIVGKQVQRVRTTAGTALAQRSLLVVRATGQKSTFIVARGTVQVQNQHGHVRLTKNQQTTATPKTAPQRPVKVDAQLALTWTKPLAWQVLTGSNVLSEPRRVAVDTQGNLYVTDEYNNRVLKLSPTGQILMQWGNPGAGPGDQSTPYPEPYGIALDPSGNIYFTDATSQVHKLSPSGQVLLNWGECAYPDCTDPNDPRILNGPEGLTLDGAGNVYVADTAHDRIVKYAADGHPLMTFGVPIPSGQVPSMDPGVLNGAEGVAVDPAGNVYAADTLNNRIQKFSATGQPLAQWGTRGDKLGQFYLPTDLTIDSRGNLYVADSGNNRIVELSPAGQSIASFDTENIPNVSGFVSPEGVVLDAQGNMYVVDRSGGRLWKYTPPR